VTTNLAVGIADLEGALAPLLDGERHGDRHALVPQPAQLALEVVDDEGEDQPGSVHVALVGRERGQAAAQEGDVHAGVLTGQRGEAVGGHLLAEPEVADEEGAAGGDVVDVQRHGGGGDAHGTSWRGRTNPVQCTP
jgi:hypothetical protein